MDLKLERIPLALLDVEADLNRGADGGRPMEDLRQSLKRYGQLDPIIVHQQDGRFQVLDGTRRVQAARELGWEDLWAIVEDGEGREVETSVEPTVASAVVNLERKALTPLDKAKYAEAILARTSRSQREVAEIIGVSPTTLSEMLKVVRSSHLVNAMRADNMPFSAARAVARVSDGEQERVALLEQIRAEKERTGHWPPVRELEAWGRAWKEGKGFHLPHQTLARDQVWGLRQWLDGCLGSHVPEVEFQLRVSGRGKIRVTIEVPQEKYARFAAEAQRIFLFQASQAPTGPEPEKQADEPSQPAMTDLPSRDELAEWEQEGWDREEDSEAWGGGVYEMALRQLR